MWMLVVMTIPASILQSPPEESLAVRVSPGQPSPETPHAVVAKGFSSALRP